MFLSAFGAGQATDRCGAEPAESLQAPPRSRAWALIQMLLGGVPYHAALYRAPAARRRVGKLLVENPIDLVYAHFLYTLPYVPRADAPPVCVDTQNVDGDYWGSKVVAARGINRWIAATNLRRVLAFERGQLDRIAAYVCVSESDAERTRAYASPPVPHILCSPNGVDTAAFTVRAPPDLQVNDLVLGFLGSLDIGMNIRSIERFYRNHWPAVRARLARWRLRLLLIGRDPAARLVRMVAGDPSVQLTGTVPDVRPWLNRVDILIAPLCEGAGTKLKTLEAMASGLPVVGSPLAFLGIGGENGRHYLRVDEDAGWGDALTSLAESSAHRAEMGREARKWIEHHFDWTAITNRLAEQLAACFKLTMGPSCP
jgi:glycosyltransferase involved in cell wall biosynthesis